MLIKTYSRSNLVLTTRFWNNHHQVHSQSQKIEKPNKGFGSNKTKGLEQDR
jgi:hypothetical protein